MMGSISAVSVLLIMCARVTLVWSAYPFTFTDRECRDLFPERIGKDSLSANAVHGLPFEIEPSETIHGVSLGGVQGAFLNIFFKKIIIRKYYAFLEILHFENIFINFT